MTVLSVVSSKSLLFTILMIGAIFPMGVFAAFGISTPVSKLLQENVSSIARLKEETQSIVGSIDELPYSNDVFYLRYCLEDKGVNELKEALKWRQGPGKAICASAIDAFQKATSAENQSWKNEPVRASAPHADKINAYITSSTTLTTSTSKGDLIYCIRAGLIDDTSLMASLDSVNDLVDFFLYCKEINALVANDRSLENDRLVYLITANDLNGLQLIGGEKTFREALGTSSKIANTLYPELNGPTLLLNLPTLVTALVKLFTPLFPPEVAARLKFERGPLKDVAELLDISYGGKDRAKFLHDVEKLIY